MELALALLYFREKECDIVILECGLGGAKDATNVIDAPALSVFSSISMDHSAVLGKTLGKIAENKAGIIKKGSGVVSLSQEEEAGQCLKRRAAREGAKYYEADPELCVSVKSSRPGETVFDIDTGRMKAPERELMRSLFSSEERREEGADTGHDGGRTRKTKGDDGGAAGISVTDGIIRDIAISLNGVWQIENAMVALLALAVLRSMGYDLIHEKQVRKYLKKAVHPGRFEVLGSDPAMVIDGAHNPDAALKLRESIDTYFGGRRLIFIIGVFADKDYDSILRYTCDKADMVITTSTPGNPRALPSIELAQAASEYNKNVTAADSVEEAFQMAYMMAGKKDVILAFGSLSYLGRLKKIYADREKKI
jgi:dihydrofolate synthase/folylpolyglutamate synthase